MDKPKISIIVPIYNAESFLSKCVDSILTQTETDLELILVNDGSSDNSLTICNNYATRDTRVKVIDQKNAGVSVARNKAIELASGDYIGFVDSDDWIASNMFENLLNEAYKTNADVVMCDATTVYSNGKTEDDTIMQLLSSKVLYKSDFTPQLLLEMAGSACRCIYKNDKSNINLRKYKLNYPVGIKFSEDRIFNLYAFGQANKVSYIKESYYYRYVNTESAVHRFHIDYFEAYKLASNAITEAIKLVWNDKEEYHIAYYSQFIAGAFGAINNYYYKTSTLNSKERRNLVKKLCDDRQLRYAISKLDNISTRENWILNRKYFLLICYAKLANIKYRR